MKTQLRAPASRHAALVVLWMSVAGCIPTLLDDRNAGGSGGAAQIGGSSTLPAVSGVGGAPSGSGGSDGLGGGDMVGSTSTWGAGAGTGVGGNSVGGGSARGSTSTGVGVSTGVGGAGGAAPSTSGAGGAGGNASGFGGAEGGADNASGSGGGGGSGGGVGGDGGMGGDGEIGGGGMSGGGGAGGIDICAPCPVGTKLVEGTCYDERDPLHGCAVPNTSNPCPHSSDATCINGQCALSCDEGEADCGNGFCESIVSTARCGSCNAACAPGEVCSESSGCVLACTPPETLCGATCVDLGSSIANCGGCNIACSAGAGAVATCNGGTCQTNCAPGLVNCFGQCRPGDACVESNCPTNGILAAIAWPTQACGCGPGFTQILWGNETVCGDLHRDTRVCGGGQGCAIGEWCNAGSCTPFEVVVAGLPPPMRVIQHDGLFYISAGSGVYAAAVTGGTPQLLASGVRPTDMAVHGTDLVFADDLGGAVYRVPLSGGGAEFIATATMPSNMVVGGDYAYWRESGSHIYRALASGGPTELVHTKINDTLLGPKVNGATSDIYFLDADFIGGGVHYNARRIQPGSSGSSPAGGATLLGGSALWDVHGTTLWLGETGTLFSVYSRLYVPPGTPAPPFGAPARVTTYASRILVDDESLFDSDDASLFESKLCNGFTTELARGLAGYMIADADYLYWLSGSTLRRVPRYGRP